VNLFNRFLRPSQPRISVAAPSAVCVVSGLPRSGTSMMMDILRSGGLSLLVDQDRPPDENNPRGYYEYQPVKHLKDGDLAWLDQARGRVVKVISALLEYLPPAYHYNVIFMQRDLDEVLASQTRMLQRSGKPDGGVDDEELRLIMQKHLRLVQAWIGAQQNMHVLYLNYADILAGPAQSLERLNAFLGGQLDVGCMAQVVDPHLYRERSAS
jgi:hypothetical protein